MLELEKTCIMRPMHSPFNTPVWPVKKPNGTWRMTVDYRELNLCMLLCPRSIM